MLYAIYVYVEWEIDDIVFITQDKALWERLKTAYEADDSGSYEYKFHEIPLNQWVGWNEAPDWFAKGMAEV